MSNLPTAVKVLKYLMDVSEPSTYSDISRAVNEGQVLVDRALTELMARGFIDRHGEDRYHYRATSEADELCRKLFALYGKVSARPQKELLVRGLLSQPGPRYLWHMNKLLEVLDREGFAREDAAPFLDKETRKGYLKRVRIIFVARISFTAPPFIPYYYMSDFRSVDANEYEQLKQQCRSLGLLMNEEDYMMDAYPPELSQPAIQYVEKEKRQIRDMLREEAFRQWQGLTYSW
jgi:DNA-binding HxlR family transcriptional regulator